jgi:26S proteasome regulatory subunit N5
LQIFLETPRARVTLLLSLHNESLAKSAAATPEFARHLQTASDLLSELQVETYSSMERREKTEYLVEQMRLLILVAQTKDSQAGKESLSDGEPEWVKARVGGRKVNEAFLKEPGNEVRQLDIKQIPNALGC